jgi:hypothetical protein
MDSSNDGDLIVIIAKNGGRDENTLQEQSILNVLLDFANMFDSFGFLRRKFHKYLGSHSKLAKWLSHRTADSKQLCYLMLKIFILKLPCPLHGNSHSVNYKSQYFILSTGVSTG